MIKDYYILAQPLNWSASKSVGQMMFYFFNIRESEFEGLPQNDSPKI
ncbi:MAG: hypothetical protein H7339_03815 [Arcicella sp.]|nr:hypothetical protein [Arcicella sp.]